MNTISPAFLPSVADGRPKKMAVAAVGPGLAQRGFSLVEIALALGIVAFAFVGLFALLPVGMGIFREAMETSVSTQIAQRIVSDLTETEFDQLLANPISGSYYTLPLRYFDDQGTEVKVTNPAGPTDLERTSILYTVHVRGSLPGKANPTTHQGDYPTSLPAKSHRRFNPRDTSFLTIQIASNPAGKKLETDPSTSLIDPAQARATRIRLHTCSVVLTRNGYAKKP